MRVGASCAMRRRVRFDREGLARTIAVGRRARCRRDRRAPRDSCGPWARSRHRRAARVAKDADRRRRRLCVRRSASCRSGVHRRSWPGPDAGPAAGRETGPGLAAGPVPGSAISPVAGWLDGVLRHRDGGAACGPSLRHCRWADSVLDSCCSLSYVRLPADCGIPTSDEPHVPAGCLHSASQIRRLCGWNRF